MLTLANRPIDLYFVIQTALIATGLLCLLVFSCSQITYYITSAALLALLFKVLYYVVSDVRSARQDPTLVSIAVGVLGVGLCLLFWRFAFARPSRLYYGFIKTEDTTAV
jgi:ABC-type nickel/cobalt efflux system permease component RcnA